MSEEKKRPFFTEVFWTGLITALICTFGTITAAYIQSGATQQNKPVIPIRTGPGSQEPGLPEDTSEPQGDHRGAPTFQK
jgi:hypothetical protein